MHTDQGLLTSIPSLMESGGSPVRPSIQELISEIELRNSSSDEQRVASAMLFREIRDRIQQGELGKRVKWREWMKNNIHLSVSNLYSLMSIADAENPLAELGRQRKRNALRQRKYVASTLSRERERDSNRLQAIRWIREASDENVVRVLRQMEAIDTTRAVGKSVASSPVH